MDDATNSTSQNDEPGAHDAPRESPGDAFASAGQHFAAAKEFASNYLSAKADAAKLSLRNVVFAIGLWIVGGLVAAAVLVTAVVFVLSGLAHAIGSVFDPPKMWVGELIVGAASLAGTALVITVIAAKVLGASRARTVEKYESKHVQQRRRFGRDVASEAGAGESVPS